MSSWMLFAALTFAGTPGPAPTGMLEKLGVQRLVAGPSNEAAVPPAVTAPMITRLSVLASADHGDVALREAQRRSRDGDESWAAWVARLRDGKALVVRLRTRVEYHTIAGPDSVDVVNDGIWIDHDVHVPKIEEQIREIAYKDTRPLHDALRRRDIDVPEAELEEMFFHVELSPDLAAMLLPGHPEAR